jgi:transcriptional regulator with XRE-family HTH domain
MAEPIGENVGRIRRRRGLTQEELAERAGVSVGVIRKLERSERDSATLGTLSRLASALDVTTVELFRPAPRFAEIIDDTSDRDDMFGIRRALQPARTLDPLSGLHLADDEQAPTLAAVREAARRVAHGFSRSDYAGTVAILPQAIADARRAATTLDGDEQTAAWAQLAEILQSTGLVLTQLRRYDLAYHAIGQAMDAARHANDPVRVAAAVNGENWLLTRQGRFDEAETGSTRTAEAIEPSLTRSPLPHIAVWGWLNLGAAAAAARNARSAAAVDAMRRARAAAEVSAPHPARDLAHWTRFSPAVVAMREAEIAVTVGEFGRALDVAPRVPDDSRPRVTYQRFQLDLITAHLEVRNRDEALGLLARLAGVAPGWLRPQNTARGLARRIARSRRTSRRICAGCSICSTFTDRDGYPAVG